MHKNNPLILRNGMKIGSNDAESDDNFLFQCFVHYPPVDDCLDPQSPTMIISGRTGSGKTAIIRYIGKTEERTLEIDPTDMSMYYVSNSDTLRFLQSIEADLDLLFQALWQHVICIEFIRLCWKINDEQKSKNVFQKIKDKCSLDQRKKKAIDYLREWEGKFWITTDQNIKKITEKYEKRIQAELGGEIKKFIAKTNYSKQLGSEKKIELISRVKKIINSEQLHDLHKVIDLLSENSDKSSQKKYFILIDKLDDNWIDVEIRFKMIRALIQSLSRFRKISNLKILIAMREDVYERVLQETKDISFQKEKYESYFVRLSWNKNDLKTLIDKRINSLFKRQYSSDNIHFDDLFKYNVGQSKPFDYLIDRTLLRPRDIISFVNECIRCSESETIVSANHIRKAEQIYSQGRLLSIEQEWNSVFPLLKEVLDFFCKLKKSSISLSNLVENERSSIESLALSLGSKEEKNFHLDPIFQASYCFIKNAQDPNARYEYVKKLCSILYRVSMIGIKLDVGEKYSFAHIDLPVVDYNLISNNATIKIHKILWSAYKISDQAQRNN